MAHPTTTSFRAIRTVRKAQALARLRSRGRGRADTGGPSEIQLTINQLKLKAQQALTGRFQPEIRAAVITTPGRAIALRALATVIGRGRAAQVGAITRQQLGRIPLTAKIAGAGLGITALTEATTGLSPIALGREALIRTIGREAQQPRAPAGPRRQQMPRRGPLAVGQELPPSHVVVRTWQTFPGGPVFARLADGHIAVQKKDGTIKHFRPYRPVVIPRKWNARSMSRVVAALKRQRKTAAKIMQITGGLPKRK